MVDLLFLQTHKVMKKTEISCILHVRISSLFPDEEF